MAKSNTPPSVVEARATAAAELVGFDPTILVSIIVAIVQALAACRRTPAQAAAEMRRPGLLARWVLRRECAKHARNREELEQLMAAVRDQGSTVTEADVAAMYAEAGQ